MKKMKDVVAVIALLGVVGTAQAAVEFKLSNETSVAVTSFQIGAVSSDEWGDNLMEGYELPADGEVPVSIDNGGVCEADILVTFADGTTSDERGVDICNLGTYSIHE
ncbi:MAG: hypothetical protein ABWY06_11080 [Pseudomonas sp.]|uniref:hypothetical protein n=1 Tax=Pseudomonas sp. TaxID=306 RepID=UPI0033946CED